MRTPDEQAAAQAAARAHTGSQHRAGAALLRLDNTTPANAQTIVACLSFTPRLRRGILVFPDASLRHDLLTDAW